MCTLILLWRPEHPWPLLLAANRDERLERASLPPGRHWPDRPEVVAGLDQAAGGSWLGLNDHGLVAAVMNREGTLGPVSGKRSRGELVLEALDHAEADAAAGALADLDPGSYRPFNLVVADSRHAYWLRHGGDGEIRLYPIPPGLHMLSATDMDDPAHPRIAAYGGCFRAADIPDPAAGDWTAWRALLTSTWHPPESAPEAAMVLVPRDGFGTRSAALLGLPRYPGFGAWPVWLHAEGRPDQVAFRPVL